MHELKETPVFEKQGGFGEFGIHNVVRDRLSRQLRQCQKEMPPSSVRIDEKWLSVY
jgi:hypothetical protein